MGRPADVRHEVAAVGSLVLAALLAACGGQRTPAALAPTLAALGDAHLRCGSGQPDNVPSGLLQWRCERVDRGVPVTVLVDGDEKGVFALTVLVPGSTDRAAAVTAVSELVAMVPPLDPIVDEASAWLSSWPGGRRATTIGSARLVLDGDSTWTNLTVFPGPRHSVGDPVPS
jgi:hypothetical protein